jgi:hypothetical protein
MVPATAPVPEVLPLPDVPPRPPELVLPDVPPVVLVPAVLPPVPAVAPEPPLPAVLAPAEPLFPALPLPAVPPLVSSSPPQAANSPKLTANKPKVIRETFMDASRLLGGRYVRWRYGLTIIRWRCLLPVTLATDSRQITPDQRNSADKPTELTLETREK